MHCLQQLHRAFKLQVNGMDAFTLQRTSIQQSSGYPALSSFATEHLVAAWQPGVLTPRKLKSQCLSGARCRSCCGCDDVIMQLVSLRPRHDLCDHCGWVSTFMHHLHSRRLAQPSGGSSSQLCRGAKLHLLWQRTL